MNTKHIILVVVALGAGFGIGYMVGKKKSAVTLKVS